ncbi:MAG: hypothetical protein M1343_09865 [Chloroflexi bacterium]|nr:hypothetical protein [Chloroflexota bacterium]
MVAAICLVFGLAAVTCGGPGATGQVGTQSPGATSFLLASGAFKSDGAIPSRFTCDGENISPRLSWSGALDGTIVFVLYALNAKLELQPDATKQQVLDAMQGPILGQAQLLGAYQKGMR